MRIATFGDHWLAGRYRVADQIKVRTFSHCPGRGVAGKGCPNEVTSGRNRKINRFRGVTVGHGEGAALVNHVDESNEVC